MSFWLRDTGVLLRRYLEVQLIFAAWGLLGGCAIFLAAWNYDLVLVGAVVSGFSCALLWNYLMRPFSAFEMISMTAFAEQPNAQIVSARKTETYAGYSSSHLDAVA